MTNPFSGLVQSIEDYAKKRVQDLNAPAPKYGTPEATQSMMNLVMGTMVPEESGADVVGSLAKKIDPRIETAAAKGHAQVIPASSANVIRSQAGLPTIGSTIRPVSNPVQVLSLSDIANALKKSGREVPANFRKILGDQ